MPSGKSSKAVRSTRSVVTSTKPRPWGTVAAVLAILVFAGGIFYYLFNLYEDRRAYKPSEGNKDPSTQIEGVTVRNYGEVNRGHIGPDKRVAYDQSPPFGGPHDATWAACNGEVYATAVRNENMVHSLEHGAVWIAYNPDQITGGALQALQDRVKGQSYLMISPYPSLDQPISLQSWGHQLKLTDPADKRIDQFIQSLRRNQYAYPEIGASCEVTGSFDPATPPPFVAEPPGPGAIPMDYAGPQGSAVPPAAGGAQQPVPPPSGG